MFIDMIEILNGVNAVQKLYEENAGLAQYDLCDSGMSGSFAQGLANAVSGFRYFLFKYRNKIIENYPLTPMEHVALNANETYNNALLFLDMCIAPAMQVVSTVFLHDANEIFSNFQDFELIYFISHFFVVGIFYFAMIMIILTILKNQIFHCIEILNPNSHICYAD